MVMSLAAMLLGLSLYNMKPAAEKGSTLALAMTVADDHPARSGPRAQPRPHRPSGHRLTRSPAR